jgi:hypothetical protein
MAFYLEASSALHAKSFHLASQSANTRYPLLFATGCDSVPQASVKPACAPTCHLVPMLFGECERVCAGVGRNEQDHADS